MADFDPYAHGAKVSEFNPHDHGATVVDDILSQANAQGAQTDQARTPQMQEEYSNPTMSPNFANLSKREKLQRIAMSQFDPANQDVGGQGIVQPGTYESPAARMIATTAPQLAMPELSAGSGMIARYGVNPVINTLARVGAGTAGNVAYQAPEIQNANQLKTIAGGTAGLNALVEAGTLPFRAPAHFAEMFNPANYASQKANQIANEYTATKETMNRMYEPVNQKYNDYPVTVTPQDYLDNTGIKRKTLYPDAKISYDNFLNEPTFKNLHNLQSKIGEDWAGISQTPSRRAKSQLFLNMKNTLQDNVQNFLSHDPEAQQQYNLASQYASNQHFPYRATPTLRSISQGNFDVQPNSLAKSIDKATKKTVGKNGRNVIPEGHPLRNHLNDLNNNINFANAAQYMVPAVGGTIAGEAFHPGMSGLLGGVSALGTSQMAKLASKFGAPTMTSFMQNPWTQNVFNKTAPWWYGGTRSAINALAPNNRK